MVKKMFVIPPDKIDTTRHPGYPEGDNRSRNAFTWNLASKKGKIFQNVLKPAIIKTIGTVYILILKLYGKNAFVYNDSRLQDLHENLHVCIKENFNHEQRKLDFMRKATDIGLFMLSGRRNIILNASKPVIIKTINKMHVWILESWDKDAFVYDDPRLQCLHENLHRCIETDADVFMHNVIDIGIFILKEDIYYRARILHISNRLLYLELTPAEISNIETFIRGVGSIDIKIMVFYTLNQLPTFELTPAEIVNIETFTEGVGSIDCATRGELENAVKSNIKNKEIVG